RRRARSSGQASAAAACAGAHAGGGSAGRAPARSAAPRGGRASAPLAGSGRRSRADDPPGGADLPQRVGPDDRLHSGPLERAPDAHPESHGALLAALRVIAPARTPIRRARGRVPLAFLRTCASASDPGVMEVPARYWFCPLLRLIEWASFRR